MAAKRVADGLVNLELEKDCSCEYQYGMFGRPQCKIVARKEAPVSNRSISQISVKEKRILQSLNLSFSVLSLNVRYLWKISQSHQPFSIEAFKREERTREIKSVDDSMELN